VNTFEEPPERRGVGNIGGIGLTRTTSKHATDAADVGDYGARIAGLRKHFRLVAVVVDYRPLHGGCADGHIPGEVLTNDGEDPVRAAERGASRIAVLDDQQTRFAVLVLHVRVPHKLVGDRAPKWEQTISRVFESPVGDSTGVAFRVELFGRQLSS